MCQQHGHKEPAVLFPTTMTLWLNPGQSINTTWLLQGLMRLQSWKYNYRDLFWERSTITDRRDHCEMVTGKGKCRNSIYLPINWQSMVRAKNYSSRNTEGTSEATLFKTTDFFQWLETFSGWKGAVGEIRVEIRFSSVPRREKNEFMEAFMWFSFLFQKAASPERNILFAANLGFETCCHYSQGEDTAFATGVDPGLSPIQLGKPESEHHEEDSCCTIWLLALFPVLNDCAIFRHFYPSWIPLKSSI